ncbi:DUF2283 domain-containing protein [Desulfurispira natronophila]|uniref:Uncharacterized protein YuzE n=1 Tax=Desulfurispira natronophila TaxID=682562 RepID=A0A7W7Y656_9BACT|nr:DUF2283 domain-containing protein [Desulfurispira natronophila]MBB5022644.1 uncharacterized protein YuzE [Desulfurispira natronophila]
MSTVIFLITTTAVVAITCLVLWRIESHDRKSATPAKSGQAPSLNVKYFSDTDTAFLQLSTQPAVQARQLYENLTVDLDAAGQIVAVTVEHVTNKGAEYARQY